MLEESFKESHEILRKHREITAITGHNDFHKHVQASKFTFFSQWHPSLLATASNLCFLYPTTHKPPLQKQPDLYKN